MADVFSRSKRSEVMSRIRSRGNQSTEVAFVGVWRRHGISGWRRNYPLFGRPDFVFPKAKIAVFVDGCFWHGCPAHFRPPKTNRRFWQNKIAKNIARDRAVSRRLRRQGWHVFRFWEHDIKQKTIARKLGRLRNLLSQTK